MLGLCLVLIMAVFSHTAAFVPSQSVIRNGRALSVKMEYIPQGLTKAQWQAIKKKVASLWRNPLSCVMIRVFHFLLGRRGQEGER